MVTGVIVGRAELSCSQGERRAKQHWQQVGRGIWGENLDSTEPCSALADNDHFILSLHPTRKKENAALPQVTSPRLPTPNCFFGSSRCAIFETRSPNFSSWVLCWLDFCGINFPRADGAGF